MKAKEFIVQSVTEYLQATCPYGSEAVSVGTLSIMAQDGSWKIYWDDLHYMVFSESTSDRELNAIHCLLLPHIASSSPAPTGADGNETHGKYTVQVDWVTSRGNPKSSDILIDSATSESDAINQAVDYQNRWKHCMKVNGGRVVEFHPSGEVDWNAEADRLSDLRGKAIAYLQGVAESVKSVDYITSNGRKATLAIERNTKEAHIIIDFSPVRVATMGDYDALLECCVRVQKAIAERNTQP